ncbi:MAG TPA: hypothetical protein DCL71_02160 [Bifidobacterium sp.]|nr:hypothetical protein [Bifidobacterium sp.]
MMTRSRLGKGLGALFPTLPGETAKPETTSAPSAQGAGQATGDGSAKGSAFVKPTVTAQASVDAVHGMSKKSVSRETKRNGGKKNSRRASVPSITLNEVSHPADMFFGSTVPAGAAPSAGHEHDAASSASAASGRNTSGNASKKADDTKKQEEQELLPVQGGYLVELHVRDVGPNLHQPRTIFDEDDLRELAESIKEVGVLQPIVVRKRPMAQIEAARKHGCDVLLFCEPVDEFLAESLREFEGKKFVDIGKGDVSFGSEAEQKAEKDAQEKATAELKPFLESVKKTLEANVSDVRVSTRLVDSPCCLVARENALSPSMVRMMRAMNEKVPEEKRILEINAEHPLVKKIAALSGDAQADAVHLLYDGALIAEGSAVADGADFMKRMTALMMK